MRKFTETHEWVDIAQNIATIGITAHAVEEIGETVYVELPQVNKDIQVGCVACVLESTKAAIDITCPVSGHIVEVNSDLQSNLQKINKSPENEGWLFRIAISNVKDLDVLLDRSQYEKMIQKGE